MNLRRGLVRTWLAASAAWLGYFGWQYFSRCSYGQIHPFEKSPIVLYCPVKREKGIVLSGAISQFEVWDFAAVGAAFFGPPMGAFIFGLIVVWVVDGFKPNSN